MKVKKKKELQLLGDLEKIPFFYSTYQCAKCFKIYFFNQGERCGCEKKHKFRAKPCYVNGIRFDGITEAKRFSRLKFLENFGAITELQLRPKFEIKVAGKKICTYEADSSYIWQGIKYIEDVKGKQTSVFKLKKKLVEALYPDINLILTF